MPAVVNVGKLYFTDDIMQKEKQEKKRHQFEGLGKDMQLRKHVDLVRTN